METISNVCARVAMLSVIIVLAKFATKRLKMKRLDKLFMKIHTPASVIMIVTAIVHTIFSFSTFSSTPIVTYILGIIGTISFGIAIFTFVRRKNIATNWLTLHRLFSIVGLVTLAVHLLSAKM